MMKQLPVHTTIYHDPPKFRKMQKGDYLPNYVWAYFFHLHVHFPGIWVTNHQVANELEVPESNVRLITHRLQKQGHLECKPYSGGALLYRM